jgi:hypothetical protein
MLTCPYCKGRVGGRKLSTWLTHRAACPGNPPRDDPPDTKAALLKALGSALTLPDEAHYPERGA